MNPEKASFISTPEKGEDFIEITECPQKQYFLSMLIRGPINASQVIKKDGAYFSHKQKMSTLESKDQTIAKANADIFILDCVFQDGDHTFYMNHDTHSDLNYHSNMITDTLNSKYTFFDFGKAFKPSPNDLLNVLTLKGKKEFAKSIRSGLPTANTLLSNLYKEFILENGKKDMSAEQTKYDNEVLSSIKEKTEILLKTVFNDNKLFKDILHKSEINLFDEDLIEYFNLFNDLDISTIEKREEIMFQDLKIKLEVIYEEVEKLIDENKNLQL